MSRFVLCVEAFTVFMTVAGLAFGVIALFAVRSFSAARSTAQLPTPAPGVTILKPMKGVDTGMHTGLASHCMQDYAGPLEILFGVSSLDDPAVAEIARLRVEYPHATLRVIECPTRLGRNGKVSNLAQMLPHAMHDLLIVNDSDIRVSPRYVTRVAAALSDATTGLVTVPYRGLALGGLWSKLEALGIATDFTTGVLTARMLEGGIRFGLGSTLALNKSTLAKIGGFEALVDDLADDYELGARITAHGLRVCLLDEIVTTTVPDYTLRGFLDHQLRWARGVRDARRGGYLGLATTHVLPWAMATVLATGGALWSWSLFSVAALVRVAVALNTGVGVLRDPQVLRDLALLPLRDTLALLLWAWSYSSDEVVWRGERFLLKRGNLTPL